MPGFFSANTWWVLGGCMLLGVSSGILGSFAMLRRQSLLGDALSHAALPGICMAFVLTGTRSLGVLLVGALAASFLGAWLIHAIVHHSRIKDDSALGIVLSVFFAFGVVLLTYIQGTGRGNQAGLDKYIFGQAAALVGSDVVIMAVAAGVVTLVSLVFFKELKIYCFDPGFAHGLGFSPRAMDLLLMALIVVAVTIGLQAVGVVLMAAMLITPAAAARYWTDRLSVMVYLAAGFGAVSGAFGTWLSATAEKMPTGPLIVLASTAVFVFSLVFAPKRGLLSHAWQHLSLRRLVAREHALRALYEMAEEAGTPQFRFRMEDFAQFRGHTQTQSERNVDRLVKEGLVAAAETPDRYKLTERGFQQAHDITRRHRLWEVFLMHEQQFGHIQAHRGADSIEHFLPETAVRELEALLRDHGLEPKIEPPTRPGEGPNGRKAGRK